MCDLLTAFRIGGAGRVSRRFDLEAHMCASLRVEKDGLMAKKKLLGLPLAKRELATTEAPVGQMSNR